jgi:hypothetical protein
MKHPLLIQVSWSLGEECLLYYCIGDHLWNKRKLWRSNWYCALCVCINDVLVQSYEVTSYFSLHVFLLNEGIVS